MRITSSLPMSSPAERTGQEQQEETPCESGIIPNVSGVCGKSPESWRTSHTTGALGGHEQKSTVGVR